MANITPYQHIFNCNCFNFMCNVEDDSFDYTITSPPYNRKRNDVYNLYNDTLEHYEKFIDDNVAELLRVTSGHVFYNIQTNYYNKEDVYKLIGKYAHNIVNVIIWEKTNPCPANGHNITNSFEYILVLQKHRKPLKGNTTYIKNVITTSINTEKFKGHSAVMKYDVAEWLVKSFTSENDTIFDPFLGCGTTALACKLNNRNCVGTELVLEYAEIACKRVGCELLENGDAKSA